MQYLLRSINIPNTFLIQPIIKQKITSLFHFPSLTSSTSVTYLCFHSSKTLDISTRYVPITVLGLGSPNKMEPSMPKIQTPVRESIYKQRQNNGETHQRLVIGITTIIFLEEVTH